MTPNREPESRPVAIPLLRLVYVSRRPEPTTEVIVKGIVSHAIERNAAINVTGVLLVGRSWFVQMLEGEGRCVSATFKRIEQDKRHSAVQVVQRREIFELLCPEWGMACMDEHRELRALLDGLSSPDEGAFDPFQASANELVLLCVAAAQRASLLSGDVAVRTVLH